MPGSSGVSAQGSQSAVICSADDLKLMNVPEEIVKLMGGVSLLRSTSV